MQYLTATCAAGRLPVRIENGTVVAAGHNSDGRCDVEVWTDILQVAAGYYHTVGLRSDGTVIAAGYRGCGSCYVGGLVGENYEGDVTNSFWDRETSGQAGSAGGTGKTTAQMMNTATFEGAGWDICAVDPGDTDDAYIWNIVHGETYPLLSWEHVS